MPSLEAALRNCGMCLWNYIILYSLPLSHFNITAEIRFYKREVLCRSTWELFFSTTKKLILEFLFYSGSWWGERKGYEPSWSKKRLKLLVFQNAEVCFHQAASWHLVYCPPLQCQWIGGNNVGFVMECESLWKVSDKVLNFVLHGGKWIIKHEKSHHTC